MIEIVVPMAGLGSRFAVAGYQQPKPLILVHGVPMIELVISNLRPSRDHRFTFVFQAEHAARSNLKERLRIWSPGCNLVEISYVTDGPASTVLLAKDHIDLNAPLLIANCDQYIDTSIDRFMLEAQAVDGLIMTMTDSDPKWSFVATDQNGRVSRVAEKQVISDQATVGVYYFRNGRSFVQNAEEMIGANERVNREFYVAPVYNRLIAKGAVICAWSIGTASSGMYGLGIPSDLEFFMAQPISKVAIKGLEGADY